MKEQARDIVIDTLIIEQGAKSNFFSCYSSTNLQRRLIKNNYTQGKKEKELPCIRKHQI